jgi:hypothetical protein
MARASNPGKAKIFLFYKILGPSLGSIQPPLRWVPGFFPGSKVAGRGVNLTSYLDAVRRLRMSVTIPLLLLNAFMSCAGKTLRSASDEATQGRYSCRKLCTNTKTLHCVGKPFVHMSNLKQTQT